MIVHVFIYEKFAEDYIQRINRLFDSTDHLFFIYGRKALENIKTIHGDNVFFSSNFNNIFSWGSFLSKKIDKANKVIIHSIFSRKLLFILLLKQKKNASKYFWMIWGGDLYNAYWNKDKNLMNKILELARKKFIRKIPAVGYIRGDFEFLTTHYKTNAKFYTASYTYDFHIPFTSPKTASSINILLANSASPSCRYEAMLKKIAKFKCPNIQIYCVLSYPNNQTYISYIKKLGHDLLGDRFHALDYYMPYNEYMKLLNSIDIALFNHNRQQALGNIASLLYLGKKVYISDENACKEYFEDMGAIVYAINDFSELSLSAPINENIVIKNRKAIEHFFSDAEFYARWEKIFSSQ